MPRVSCTSASSEPLPSIKGEEVEAITRPATTFHGESRESSYDDGLIYLKEQEDLHGHADVEVGVGLQSVLNLVEKTLGDETRYEKTDTTEVYLISLQS